MLNSAHHLVRCGTLGSRSLQLQSGLSKVVASPPALASRALTTKAPASSARARAAAPLLCEFATRRYASAVASPSSPAASAAATAAAEARKLDWNTFFTLRKTRRRYQVACSFATMLLGGTVAGAVLVDLDMDWMGKIPLDPFVTLGLMTMGSAALGWLAGPSLGSAIFYSVKRGIKQPMAIKEAEFFARIKKNRVDPSVSSVQNPGKCSRLPPVPVCAI